MTTAAAPPASREADTLRLRRASDIAAADARERVRSAGTLASLLMVGAAVEVLLPREAAVSLLCAVLGVAGARRARAAYFAGVRARAGDGGAAARALVDVREAAGKGYGAFARRAMARHTYLGDYAGELISNEELRERTARGAGDYAVCSGDGAALDGYADAQDRSRFTLAHTNHAPRGSREANLFRVKLSGGTGVGIAEGRGDRADGADREDAGRPRWAFFTSRDVAAGEELQWTYSDGYWEAREGEIV